ncbi:hypothetical protein [Pseudomonas aeruginosa]|uniref:hypothetical protein n=1 Tax=Pseudomonas aeruginosa TaxID=287 RepID=UPI0007105497|nr:hypothetical protein [Pseudomonas aeruginosa]
MADKLYKCSRCDGAWKIWLFTAVLGGVCFQCGGSGKQKTKPKPRAVKWAVFGHSRETGKIGRLYNVSARTQAEAINKARDTYDRASSAWRDEWSMQQAFAQTWAKLQEAGTLETAGIS